MKKIKRCEGEHQPSGDEGGVDGDEPGGLTTQLTNGTKKAADGEGVRLLVLPPPVLRVGHPVVGAEGGFHRRDFAVRFDLH